MPIHVTKHKIDQEWRSTISCRYKAVTKAFNSMFWESNSETAHSRYVGSYGRGTAIQSSDLDILLELPPEEYPRFDKTKWNGQSRLLQAVKQSIEKHYSLSDIRADGQVVKIKFSDGMKFELLPAFKEQDCFGDFTGTYAYPDSNMGGYWRSADPITEQQAMSVKNGDANTRGLLVDTCKHIRHIRDTFFKSYHLSGIVIDSFVYDAIGDWHWMREGETSQCPQGSYEQRLLNHYNTIQRQIPCLSAPGSAAIIDASNSMECFGKVLHKIAD